MGEFVVTELTKERLVERVAGIAAVAQSIWVEYDPFEGVCVWGKDELVEDLEALKLDLLTLPITDGS